MSPHTEPHEAPGPSGETASIPGVSRMFSAHTKSLVERFDNQVLLTEGKVNIIALDAVVERFGTRWPAKRDQVYQQVEKTLERHLGVQGFYGRVSETDFLIAHPDLSQYAGQAACLRYLREILGHFLGEAHLADGCVHAVRKISPTGMETEPVDVRRIEAAERAPAAQAPPEITTQGGVNAGAPFMPGDGRPIRVSCVMEPVYELKGFGRIGFRIARRVLRMATEEQLTQTDIANLTRLDILRIDLATIARGLDRLKSEGGGNLHPSLIIPVSYTSLSSQRGRAEIIAAFEEVRASVERGVICEICDIEGVPQFALLSAVSLIRPFALFVVGRLNVATPKITTSLKGTGIQALSVECPADLPEGMFVEWAKTAIGAANLVVRSVLIYRVHSAGDAAVARLLGATHATLRAL